MFARLRFALIINACVCCIALWGCVERKERLQISPGGSVFYRFEGKSDSAEDLYEGDAIPRPAGGWMAQQEVENRDDGTQSHRLIAETVFPAGTPLPSNFALRTEADGDLCTQFPTTLKIERRSDGTYYHFARTYAARPWMFIEALRERHVLMPTAELRDVKFEDWTPEQRLTVVRALATFETEKSLVFARAAYKRATPEAPQDGWLLVQQHLRDCVNHYDYADLAKLLEPRQPFADESARGEAVAAQLKDYDELTDDQLKQALFTIADYNGSQYEAFIVEFDRQKKAFAITEDLGDDKFEITVELPGEIIASNAEETSGGSATWTFDGGAVRDREMELMVTSRVPK